MSIDIFSPRAMAQALLQMKPPRTFLRQLMIRRDEMYTTETVDVDIKVGARRLAPFINPNVGPGKVMDRIGFSTRSYKPPMVAPKRPITVSDVMDRRAVGENIYSTQTPDERMALLLGQDLAEIDEDITRREEWECAQAAFNTGTFGGVPGTALVVTGDDVSDTIVFPRSAELLDAVPGAAPNGLGTAAPTSTKLTAARCWDQTTADIPVQFRQMRRLFQKKTGLSPDFLLMGELAADALISAPSLSGLSGFLNTRRLDLGLISPELREGGATYYGQFAGTGVDIWGYDEWFIDPADGVEKPMVPPKMVLMGSSKSYTVMRYGAVGVSSGLDGQAQLALVSGRRIPESWVNKEPAVRFLKVSARPLVVPVQNDAYITCQVLA